ncbi:DUF2631 domain-containing protein [Rhodococcus sp. MEB064]|uniref:DUF2631 domain-containing protein n=1 Tax=Rhodococcus sp. MEB064 TaxID=1587522 RepID=UPI000AA87F5D
MTDISRNHASDVDRVPTTNVSTAEVPSAEWGWSGEGPRTSRIAGWVTVAILLVMIIGNHSGRVEDLWLIGFAAAIAFILVRDVLRRRKPRHS